MVQCWINMNDDEVTPKLFRNKTGKRIFIPKGKDGDLRREELDMNDKHKNVGTNFFKDDINKELDESEMEADDNTAFTSFGGKVLEKKRSDHL